MAKKVVERPKTKLILPKHHSLADWDYRPGCLFGLYADQYISAPSCLRAIVDPPEETIENFYLKAALAPEIHDGRIVDWTRVQNDAYSYSGYLFRVQDTPFDSFPLNCYRLHKTREYSQLYRVMDGEMTKLLEQATDPYDDVDTWYHWRLTFWQYAGGDLASILRITLEIEVDGEWTQLWYIDDADNLWAESEVNRIGFYATAYPSGKFTWRDNTEIWRAIEA